jgi:hypothetical protein
MMCKQNFYLEKRRFFKGYKKIRTHCACGAESKWEGFGEMLDAGYTSEQIREAINKLVREAR